MYNQKFFSQSHFKYMPILCLITVLLAGVPYLFISLGVHINRDSGIFLYTGWIISQGGMPYIDSWDHKGPLLYLMNALGFILFKNPGGVYAFEGILFFISFIFSVCQWKKVASLRVTVLTSILFILSYYSTFGGGNLTESWLIPFTLSTYSYVAVCYYKNNSALRSYEINILGLMLGVSLSVAFLTRMNNAGGLILLFIFCLLWMRNYLKRYIFTVFLSFSCVCVPIVYWIFYKGAMESFIEQYILYNFFYSSGSGLRVRIESFLSLSISVLATPLGFSTVLAAFGAVGFGIRSVGKNQVIIFCAILIFIFDFLSQSISGRSYLHYVSIVIPSLAILFLFIAAQYKEVNFFDKLCTNIPLAIILFLAIGILFIKPFYRTLYQTTLNPLENGIEIPNSYQNRMVRWVEQKTDYNDQILVHGGETWLLAAAGRRSPTSITYYYPAVANFRGAHEKYVTEVIDNPPLYVIEAPGSCGLSGPPCYHGSEKVRFKKLRDFLKEYYHGPERFEGFNIWKLSNRVNDINDGLQKNLTDFRNP